MKSALLDNCGVHFAYIDSGAPDSADYTTLICIHGNTYHAQTFQRVLPIAAQQNIRLVALNRRDYVGSTPFSDNELSILHSNEESNHRQFLYDRGLEIAYFLLWVVDELKVPRICNGGKAGGIGLLGWSLGNITSIAFLANLARYPKEVTQELEPYLRHYFIYEVVYQFFGLPSPEGAYHPLWDDQIPMDNKPAAIDAWFTSYFSHPCFIPLSSFDSSQKRELNALQLRSSSNPVKPSTTANRTPEECALISDTVPVMRSEIAFYFTVRESTLYEQYIAALASSSVSDTPNLLLPNLRVSVIDATHTVWNIIWASWEIEKDVKKWKEEGRVVRPIDFVTIEGANHYGVWDEPELFMKTLASCLK